ncbi:hypothetical protein CA11_07660 [Gimesia maris]|uniref:hypothetical protein n=1 Tax=Gimesia maris TaxID=122 RepID=UPI001188F3FD|nr:hypothetical protein [Gimesia maris]QDU12984.1 hypothetical protein CA11_07660 [Gimesia maris]
MADWLKIPSKNKRREEDIPEPYEIVCVCGVSLSGYRRKGPYRHACQQCNEAYFILPRNTYPAPKARKKKKQLPKQQQLSDFILNSAFVTRLREKRKAKQEARKPAEANSATETRAEVSPFELPAPRTRLITPFRGILAGIILIVGLTGYGILNSRKMEQASDALKAATQTGNQMLEQEDLIAANDAYQEAFQALTVLGRTDPAANEIRQTSRELLAMNTQAVSPLFEIAEEAVVQIKQSGVDSWKTLFEVRYADTWIIFEATLLPVESLEETEQSRYRLNLPVLLDEYTLYLELTEPAFEEYLESHQGHPVIFAAQIVDFQQDASRPDTGIIELNGETAFLWSHLKLYKLLGIEFDEFQNREQIEKLLNQQSRFLGLTE